MYPCRCLDWAKEQKHMIYHALGPNVKKKLWASDKKKHGGQCRKKTWTGQAHSSFFDIPVASKYKGEKQTIEKHGC